MANLKIVSSTDTKPKDDASKECPFKIDDKVHLTSGGPLMVVETPGPVWTTCRFFSDLSAESCAESFKNINLKLFVDAPKKSRVVRKCRPSK